MRNTNIITEYHRVLLKNNLDLARKRYGTITILGEPFSIREENNKKYRYVVVECDCGEIVTRRLDRIISADQKVLYSCRQCVKKSIIKHGDSKTRLFSIWSNMLWRCKTQSPKFKRKYVNKNIKVCDDWLIFDNFKVWSYDNGYIEEDTGIPIADKLSIDRIDSRLNYTPDNCRWVPMRENSANVARERDRRIDLLETQVFWYEQHILDNSPGFPDEIEMMKFHEMRLLLDKPKPLSVEDKKKIQSMYDEV